LKRENPEPESGEGDEESDFGTKQIDTFRLFNYI
jgi:hypothetical protein